MLEVHLPTGDIVRKWTSEGSKSLQALVSSIWIVKVGGKTYSIQYLDSEHKMCPKMIPWIQVLVAWFVTAVCGKIPTLHPDLAPLKLYQVIGTESSFTSSAI